MGEWVIVSEPVVYGLDAAPPEYAKRFYSFKINELIDLESWYLKKWFSDCKTWLDVVAKVIKEIKYPLDWLGRPTDYHYLQCFRKYPAKCYKTYKIDADFWQCLPPQSLVLGSTSEIEKVEIGMNVLSHTGTEAKVLHTFSRPYRGYLVKVKTAFIHIPIRLTLEHPVLVVRRPWCGSEEHGKPCEGFLKPLTGSCKRCRKVKEWDWAPKFIPAKDLQVNDYLLIPRRKTEKIPSLPFKVNKETCYLMGLYLAEGSVSDHQVQLALGKHEKELLEKTLAIIEKYIDPDPYVYEMETEYLIVFGNKKLKQFFRKYFGAVSHEKRIPDFVKDLPKDLLRSFIDGYIDGDGCRYIDKRGKVRVSISTASKYIAFDIIECCAKLGFLPHVSYYVRKDEPTIEGRRFRKDFYIIQWQETPQRRRRFRVDENYIYVPIASVEFEWYEGVVYNLETTSGTYCVPFVVHNCASETAFYGIGDCEDSSVLCGAGHDLLGYMYWVELGIVKKRGQVLGGHAWEISVDDTKTWRLVETTLDVVPRKFPVVDPDAYVHRVGDLEYEAFIRFDSAFCEVRKDLVRYVNDGGDIVGELEFHMCLNCYVTYRKAMRKREKKKLKVIRESWREAGFV